MKLAITTAIMRPVNQLVSNCVLSHSQRCNSKHELVYRDNTPEDNLGVTGSLQWCYENTTAPIIAHLHSDVEIFEQGWDERVLKEFDDREVGVVGFGGAKQLGENDIYKVPYRLTQLRRIDYMSAQRDWETHGSYTRDCFDVSTLDGFALIVRRELLDKWKRIDESRSGFTYLCLKSGWPVERYPFHNYDNALCLEAAKQGYRVRLVGIDCLHHGGVTSTSPAGQAHWQAQGTTDAAIHEQSHLALYEDGRGILPWRVK